MLPLSWAAAVAACGWGMIMLGDHVGDLSGRITGQRVLPAEGVRVRVETSFEGTGSLLGVQNNGMGTYIGIMRADGTIQGEGQGVQMSAQGDHASWVGQGVGTFTEDGGVSYRGAIYYDSPSEAWAPLNRVAVVYEFETSADGSVKGTFWEWK